MTRRRGASSARMPPLPQRLQRTGLFMALSCEGSQRGRVRWLAPHAALSRSREPATLAHGTRRSESTQVEGRQHEHEAGEDEVEGGGQPGMEPR